MKMKKLNMILIFATIGIVSISQNLWAAPFKYAKCTGLNINQPKNSGGYVMDDDCKTVYVLPPEEGLVRMTNFVPALNENQCNVTMGLMKNLSTIMNRAETLSQNLSKEMEWNEKVRSDVNQKAQSCFGIEEKAQTYEAAVITIQGEVDKLEVDKTNLVAEKSRCETDAQRNCTRFDRAIEQKTKKIGDLTALKTRRDSEGKAIRKQFENCEQTVAKQLESVNKRIKDSDARIEETSKKIKTLVDQHNEIIVNESEVPGATIAVTFSTQMNKNLEEFKQLNTTIADKVQFVQMPLNDMKIHFSAVSDGISAKIPVVLSSDISGLSLTKGTDASELAVAESQRRELVMGQSLGGQIVINRLATCNMISQLKKNYSGLISSSVSYKYDVMTRRSYRFHYIESHLYNMIKRHTTSNGFFRSSSSNSITEESSAKQWIDIRFDAEDSRNGFEDTMKIAEDIRKEFLNSALMKVAVGYLQEGNPAIINAGPSGADRASGAIKKCPHIYCQAAGIVLDIGSALFGGSSSSAEITKNANAEHSTKFTETKPVAQYGTSSFRVDGFNE
jgi:hypothetical protein